MSGYGLTDSRNSPHVDDEENEISLNFLPLGSRVRKLTGQASVILPKTGERVQRSVSSFSIGFESFNSRGIEDNPSESSSLLPGNNNGNGNALAPSLSNVTLEGSPESSRWNFKRVYRRSKRKLEALYANDVYKSVLKCSIAYFLASLGVYWLRFDDLLGRTDSKHVVATVAVYFHPSRSKGSMHQSLLFVICSLLFSFSMTFFCRLILRSFFNHGEDEICYAIDLIVASLSLGCIAYMKQKINKQTFNTACSLASISIVACIIKEGSTNASEIPVDRFIGTIIVVVTGCTISVLCCYLIWPVSAVEQLRKGLNDSYNIMSGLLSITANRFLNGENITAKDIEFFNRLNKNITSLNSLLEEAQYELLLRGREEEWKLFVKLVSLTKALARHVQALRSSVEMQWELLHENDGTENNNNSNDADSVSSDESIDSRIHLSQSIENMSKIQSGTNTSDVPNYTASNPAQIFDLFVYYLAPSMKSFIFTIKNILSEVPFENQCSGKFATTATFQRSIDSALDLYKEKQAESFERLYSQEIFHKKDSNHQFLFNTDQEEVTACCGNFSSLLGEFARTLNGFLKLTERYEETTQCKRSWNYLYNSLWHQGTSEQGRKDENGHGIDAIDLNENAIGSTGSQDPPQETGTERRVSFPLFNTRVESTLNAALLAFQSQYRNGDENGAHSRSILKKRRKVHSRLSVLSFNLWKSLKVFKRTDVQFGIRVGLGALLISIFAFIPQTKIYFNEWRIEWALVVYCIMMNKSVGGTSMTIKYRFIGTFLGCYGAYLIWVLTNGNVYCLCLCGFLLSIPSFYIIMYWKQNNPFGRFILLAYNITALYSYSMTQKDAEDGLEGGEDPIIGEIAFHRFFAVSVGILVSVSMSSLFLPNSARSRLKKGLTILWLRMGVIWNSDPLDYTVDGEMKLIGLKDQKGLHDLLRECETLLKQAPKEFRLKGEFPKVKYEKILQSTSSIIDSFQNMNLMIEVDPNLSINEEYVLKYISAERTEVEHRIFLIFYMLASALRLSFPLPNKPASTEHAKDRMLFKLSEIRSNGAIKKDLTLTNEDYVLLYSYILVTNKISLELDRILELVRDLIGDIDEEIFELV